MTTAEDADASIVTSVSSLEISSSQWSQSTENIAEPSKAPENELVQSKEETAKGCYPVVALLRSMFQRRKTLTPADTARLLAELKTHTELFVAYFDGLGGKLRSEADKIYYPKSVPYEVTSKYGGTFSLPATQVWAATYLIKFCSQTNVSQTDSPNCRRGATKQSLHLNTTRQLFVELCWEKAFAKRVGSNLYTRLTKFTNDISKLLRKLNAGIPTSPSAKSDYASFFPSPDVVSLLDDQASVEVNFKKEKIPMVLELGPVNGCNFPFSLSVDTQNANGEYIERNQDCCELRASVQEEIITGMLRSALDSLQNCNLLLDSVSSQICTRGLIRKASGSMRDVTCYSALKTIKAILRQFIYAKNKINISESDKYQLQLSFFFMYKSWTDFVGHAQLVLVKFLELCDIIQICHLFLLHHTKLPLPDVAMIEREINVKNRFRNYKPIPIEERMKDYAIESLMEESSLKSVDGSSTSLSTKPEKGVSYEKMMICTRYPLVLQDNPLEWSNSCRKYNILLRPVPDYERIGADMIVADQAIATRIVKHECVPTLKLSSVEVNKL